MRLIGNFRLRELGWGPMPLEVCPGRRIWEMHRRCDYRVFVDESFYRFFGFDDPDGNFCHAAVGIPENQYERLKELIEPIAAEYKRRIVRLHGDPPDEIKFSLLNTLPLSFRVRLTRVLVNSLAQTGGFVSGFYTPTSGHVMERVRTNLLGNAEEVPADHGALYEIARNELLEQFRGVGQSALITALLFLPVAGVTRLLGSFGCNFRVQYDPRQQDEDRAVRIAIGEYMDELMRLPDPFGHNNIYLGMSTDITSQNELGLQLADVFAGEVRNFFRNDELALSERATPRLITPTSDEPLQQFERLDGIVFKTGSLSPMSRGLARRLVQRNTRNLVSYYYPVLAAGMLTCVTSNGQERHLELPTRMIFDLTD